MTLQIELSTEEETRLAAAGRQEGASPSALVKRWALDHLSRSLMDDPILALFNQWAEEDASMTPEEQEAEQADWEQFKANINAKRDRAGARRVL